MKTIEERAKEYADECCSRKGELITLKDSDVNEYIKDAFNECAGVMQRWISVEEELPENDDIVLVKTDNGSITIAYLHGKKSGFITYGEEAYKVFGDITHWRPINFK